MVMIDRWAHPLVSANRALMALRLHHFLKVWNSHPVVCPQVIVFVPIGHHRRWTLSGMPTIFTATGKPVTFRCAATKVFYGLCRFACRASLCFNCRLRLGFNFSCALFRKIITARSAPSRNAKAVARVRMKIAQRLVFVASRTHFHGAILP